MALYDFLYKYPRVKSILHINGEMQTSNAEIKNKLSLFIYINFMLKYSHIFIQNENNIIKSIK